jgi:hypothetical protein
MTQQHIHFMSRRRPCLRTRRPVEFVQPPLPTSLHLHMCTRFRCHLPQLANKPKRTDLTGFRDPVGWAGGIFKSTRVVLEADRNEPETAERERDECRGIRRRSPCCFANCESDSTFLEKRQPSIYVQGFCCSLCRSTDIPTRNAPADQCRRTESAYFSSAQKHIFFVGPKVHIFRRTKSTYFSPDRN